MTGKDTMLLAFDRLFDKAAAKLHIECSSEEKDAARQSFQTRFAGALEMAQSVSMDEAPEEILQHMEEAIASLSPAQVVAQLAVIPLLQQAQEMARILTYRAAEQRMLDHLIEQVDDKYGGN